jgi:hypothetical protein
MGLQPDKKAQLQANATAAEQDLNKAWICFMMNGERDFRCKHAAKLRLLYNI